VSGLWHKFLVSWGCYEYISREIPVLHGDFAEVSALMKGWETKFQTLVSQRRLIKCDMYPLPNIPKEFKNSLVEQGYDDLVLEKDRWQHFLVPNSN
jgi:hypothetical protein